LELTLSGVNEEQSFDEPSDAKSLEALFKKLDINPIELLESSQEGLGGLLEGLDGGVFGGTSGDSGQASGKEYAQCLREVQTSADLQKCADLRK
jgi:hypothetical protein